MTGVFTVILSLGIIGLLIGLLFDHDVDPSLDDGPGFTNTKVLSSFAIAFGAVGLLAKYNGFGLPVSTGLGVAGGVVLGGAVWGLLYFIGAQQSSSHVESYQLLGAKGVLTAPVGADAPGEVQLRDGTYHLATAKGPLNEGVPVIVTEVIGTTLVVRPQD